MRTLLTLLVAPFLLQLSPTTRVGIDASQQIMLWNQPAAQTPDNERDDGTGRFRNVSRPMLFVWPAEKDKANGAAIVICPGGSYDHITMELEGQRIAKWLNPMGVAVFGLKYHTRPPSQDVAADALADGQRAIRLVRSHAMELNIDPGRIGLMGYSAGSNLGLNLASHFDTGKPNDPDPIERQSCRPDFVVLLSTWPNGQTLDKFPLSADSPPIFIAIAKDDRTAPPPFTAAIVAKLNELKVPVKLYEAERGGHGAFHLDERNVDTGWKPVFLEWLKKYMTK